ncbi:hypothetical protein FNF27_04867 [Cafeteria roenbergensis]|uniref:phenylalanine 4-monooxygenase n=1 Tax=Cafeteria roenbergensis TaxID=33653 RepID=A0A5A8E8S3_CAFRO|nr:hypothetical protein FNF27_04867 [Cafeteria roenbergensis]
MAVVGRAIASLARRHGGRSLGVAAARTVTTSAVPASAQAANAQPTGEFAGAGFRHGDSHKARAPRRTQGAVEGTKVSLMFRIYDKPGALVDVLTIMANHGISLTRIESKPTKASDKLFDFQVDFEGTPEDPRLEPALKDLRAHTVVADLQEAVNVPWFPTRARDIDEFSAKTLDAGAELEADHPGFKDAEYRERRRMIVKNATTFRHGDTIPRVEYTAQEVETWGLVYSKLREYTDKYAVSAYKEIMPLMEEHCGYAEDNIPQAADISRFLHQATGFTLRPVSGLLSARDFLNALAFRVFFSTQYIRHHSRPLYTPEPDICHELMGHAPMFADPDFASFSHEIGLASLGASDEEIERLATCYWFSVEFGLCMEDGQRKAYGAGLLSSFGELEFACSPDRPAGGRDDFPKYKPWEPEVAAVQEYPITTYQPVYFVAESMQDAKERMRDYCEGLARPFGVRYEPYTSSVSVDRALVRMEPKREELEE